MSMLRPAMFPSTSANSSIPNRTDSLNATQRRAPASAQAHNVLSKARPRNEADGLSGSRGSGDKPFFIPKDEGFFMQVEEELHDLRRVRAHGQEDDLGMALDRCMGRVGELAGLLSAAYTAFSDLRIELDVTRSNLQMISANNEMLEDALKNISSQHGTNPRQVGWRRSTPNPGTPSSSSTHVNTFSNEMTSSSGTGTPLSPAMSSPPPSSSFAPMGNTSQQLPPPPSSAAPPPPVPPPQESRFFRFRFNSASSSSGNHNPTVSSSSNSSRPQTPVLGNDPQHSPTIGYAVPASVLGNHHTASSSSVSLAGAISGSNGSDAAATTASLTAELESLKPLISNSTSELSALRTQLASERSQREKASLRAEQVVKEKEALEGELESLSQALFEEANNMVASERKMRAEEVESERRRRVEEVERCRREMGEMGEELREAREQKIALRSALKILEGEVGGFGSGGGNGGGGKPMSLDLSISDDVLSSSSPSSLPPQTAYSALPQTASTTFGANEPEPELASISRSRSSSRDAIKSLPSSSRPSSPLSASLDSELLHGSGGGGGGAAPGHGEATVLTTLSYGAGSGSGLDPVASTTTTEPPPLRPVSEPRPGLESSSSSSASPLPHQSHLHHHPHTPRQHHSLHRLRKKKR
ncbi:hypothetical protein D9757_014418 [Collybiopsis confluens]|uniref:GDP/GTP exchange factor Sec2 N-terminal domain-containing protein n=1 Tax=Collybiopsis confluens TaxID=2823264 RepID=A0A8H5CUQ2_9AGAR|nr:hypothetical protein D9757_014418 [Collybiopsis confluens]